MPNSESHLSVGSEMQTPPPRVEFDFSAYPEDTLFYDRRVSGIPTVEPKPKVTRVKKERRRRVDPTTFEKQYAPDELEFMNAMQQFKMQSGKPFPTHGEVLRVVHELGYRRKA